MAGISTARISDYESGQREISKTVVRKLSAVFGVSPVVLFEIEPMGVAVHHFCAF